MKKLLSVILIFTMCFSVSSPAIAVQYDASPLISDSITIGDQTYTYKYRTQNNMISYIEMDGDVIERIGNDIFINGDLVASISVIKSNNDDIQPYTGWIWSETGNDSDYETIGSTEIYSLDTKTQLEIIKVEALISVLLIVLPLKSIAKAIAEAIINGVFGAYTAYKASTNIYCVETTHKHKYAPYNKKMIYEYYYDGNLDDEVPGSRRVLYGTWA